jgi:hypothetical protein
MMAGVIGVHLIGAPHCGGGGEGVDRLPIMHVINQIQFPNDN